MSTNTPELNLSVTFRHTEPTEALKNYAVEKITNILTKYLDNFTAVDIILTVQKRDHMAEVNLHSKRRDVTAKAITDDLYSAIDKVTDNVAAQLRKQKERKVNHKHQGLTSF